MQTLIDRLSALVDKNTLVIADDISEKYHADWSGADPCEPAALLKPKSTEELSQIMALCHEYDQPVVVQGGLTGLAGGATPQAGEFAISLERMAGIEAIDARAMTVTAHAGTPLQVCKIPRLNIIYLCPSISVLAAAATLAVMWRPMPEALR